MSNVYAKTYYTSIQQSIELHFSMGCQGLDYQNFRAGNASGARGEMASLCASVREQTEGVPYKTWRKSQRPRLVPLIGFFPKSLGVSCL